MALKTDSGEVVGDPQSPNYKEPQIEKEMNPGFKHWFNKHMNRLQIEFMELKNEEFMKWAEEQWKN